MRTKLQYYMYSNECRPKIVESDTVCYCNMHSIMVWPLHTTHTHERVRARESKHSRWLFVQTPARSQLRIYTYSTRALGNGNWNGFWKSVAALKLFLLELQFLAYIYSFNLVEFPRSSGKTLAVCGVCGTLQTGRCAHLIWWRWHAHIRANKQTWSVYSYINASY